MDCNYFYHPAWPVLFQDNHLLVLYKPAGVLVQGDETQDISLLELGKAWLKEQYRKPGRVFLGMVHRLDRPVAGVVLFCRTSKAASRLSEQFRMGRAKKRYLAIVEGNPEEKAACLAHLIERRDKRSSRIVEAPTASSQEARLSYRVIDTSGTRSLLEVHLETGRRHQIRVQLARIGHPIVGDLRYGASAALPQAQIALLARELTIEHPTRKEKLLFLSPIPTGWPWPTGKSDLTAPWNWSELRPMICTTNVPSSPCSFPNTMKE